MRCPDSQRQDPPAGVGGEKVDPVRDPKDVEKSRIRLGRAAIPHARGPSSGARSGRRGVGIPLKSPTLAIEVLLGLFAIGLLVAEGFGVWRMATGHGWRPVVGTVLLLPSSSGSSALAPGRAPASPRSASRVDRHRACHLLPSVTSAGIRSSESRPGALPVRAGCAGSTHPAEADHHRGDGSATSASARTGEFWIDRVTDHDPAPRGRPARCGPVEDGAGTARVARRPELAGAIGRTRRPRSSTTSREGHRDRAPSAG